MTVQKYTKMWNEKKEEMDNYVTQLGRYEGRKLKDIPLKEMDKYLEWIEKQDNVSGRLKVLKGVLTEYLKLYSDELESELDNV